MISTNLHLWVIISMYDSKGQIIHKWMGNQFSSKFVCTNIHRSFVFHTNSFYVLWTFPLPNAFTSHWDKLNSYGPTMTNMSTSKSSYAPSCELNAQRQPSINSIVGTLNLLKHCLLTNRLTLQTIKYHGNMNHLSSSRYWYANQIIRFWSMMKPIDKILNIHFNKWFHNTLLKIP